MSRKAIKRRIQWQDLVNQAKNRTKNAYGEPQFYKTKSTHKRKMSWSSNMIPKQNAEQPSLEEVQNNLTTVADKRRLHNQTPKHSYLTRHRNRKRPNKTINHKTKAKSQTAKAKSQKAKAKPKRSPTKADIEAPITQTRNTRTQTQFRQMMISNNYAQHPLQSALMSFRAAITQPSFKHARVVIWLGVWHSKPDAWKAKWLPFNVVVYHNIQHPPGMEFQDEDIFDRNNQEIIKELDKAGKMYAIKLKNAVPFSLDRSSKNLDSNCTPIMNSIIFRGFELVDMPVLSGNKVVKKMNLKDLRQISFEEYVDMVKATEKVHVMVHCEIKTRGSFEFQKDQVLHTPNTFSQTLSRTLISRKVWDSLSEEDAKVLNLFGVKVLKDDKEINEQIQWLSDDKTLIFSTVPNWIRLHKFRCWNNKHCMVLMTEDQSKQTYLYDGKDMKTIAQLAFYGVHVVFDIGMGNFNNIARYMPTQEFLNNKDRIMEGKVWIGDDKPQTHQNQLKSRKKDGLPSKSLQSVNLTR